MNNTYLRMAVLLLPFIDYHFCNQFEYEKNGLEMKILLCLKHHGNIENIDEVRNIIGFYFVKDRYQTNDFFELLERLSSSLLTYHNEQLVVDVFHSEINNNDILAPFHNKIIPFVEINKLISDNLLMVIYNYNHDYDLEYVLENNLIKPISVVNYQLQKILDKGMAETHTHLFGSTPFEVQWGWMMNKLYSDNYPIIKSMLDKLDSTKRNLGIQYHKQTLGIEGSLKEIILTSSIMRVLMMNYLVILNNQNIFVGFKNYIRNIVNGQDVSDDDRNYLIRIINNFHHCRFKNKDSDYITHFRLMSLFTGNLEKYYETMMKSTLSIKEASYFDDNSINKQSGMVDYYLYEYIFLFKCYESIKLNSDVYFQEMFFQYIRYKNVFNSLINQSSEIKGFFEFQMYFKSQHSLMNTSSVMFTPIFQTYAYENIKYLEIRIGHIRPSEKDNLIPSDVLRTMANTFLKFINSYRVHLQCLNQNEDVVKAGIILHFNKQSDQYRNKCWYEYITYGDRKMLNYEAYREECFINLVALAYLRGRVKNADKFIIGIDAASNELLTEPWVLAPVFRSIRDRWQYILNEKMKYYDMKSYRRSSPLGVTYHVGEVFNSIISGLRHVDEVVDHYGFQSGERLGHATILGIDTNKYSREKKVVTLPVLELLDNWLWLYHLKSEYNLLKDVSQIFIENRIYKYARLIYENVKGHISGNITIHNLYEAYLMQFDETKIDHDFFIDCNLGEKDYPCYFAKEQNSWSSKMLFYSRHCNCYLKRMNKMIQIEIDDDLLRDIYIETQQYVLKKIANKGIIVEVNPLSNVFIGEISDVFNHPIYKMNDTYKDDGILSHVITTINTDNPGVFSTTLSNQFGFIEQMISDKGYSKEQALNWIDKLRENGLNSTFIKYKRLSRDEILAVLDELDNGIKKLIS